MFIDRVMLRGDNVAAVSWIKSCGGSRNRHDDQYITINRYQVDWKSQGVGVNIFLGVQNV